MLRDKTAVIGASSYLGRHFLAHHRRLHPDCLATTRRPGEEAFLDLARPDIKPLRLAATGHRDALLLAAVSKPGDCEAAPRLTRNVNVDGTLELAARLAAEGIKTIFTSSDYVFDGTGGPYGDDDPPKPVNEYGRQKAEVERRLPEATKGNFLIVRISKAFDLEKGGGTLLDEIAAVLGRGGVFKAARDQVFCPTLVTDLIAAVSALQRAGATGVYNVCAPEAWARYDLARALAQAMDVPAERVEPISIDEIPGVKRPKSTPLRPEKLARAARLDFTPMARCIEQVAEAWIAQRPKSGL